MIQPLNAEPRKPYSKPIFVIYGTVQELRRASGTQADKIAVGNPPETGPGPLPFDIYVAGKATTSV
jgi:hypothetical protein